MSSRLPSFLTVKGSKRMRMWTMMWCTVFSTLAKMLLHRGRSYRSSGSWRRCATFLSRPEGPGKTEGSGFGSSGGRETGKSRELGIVDLGGKTWGKTQIRRGKEKNWWKRRVGKQDLRATHIIHGSNPTKSHQTNKSQKIWGYFWWGFSDFRTKSSKRRIEKEGQGLQICDQLGSDTKMM